jgi:hypothetical protein
MPGIGTARKTAMCETAVDYLSGWRARIPRAEQAGPQPIQSGRKNLESMAKTTLLSPYDCAAAGFF